MRALRFLGFFGALVAGFLLWGLSIALLNGGGGVPFGASDKREDILFCIPIVVFAFPLAFLAFRREYVVTGTWILAAAPVFGLLNLVLSVFLPFPKPQEWNIRVSTSTLWTLLAAWLILLGLILAAITPPRRAAGSAQRSSDAE